MKTINLQINRKSYTVKSENFPEASDNILTFSDVSGSFGDIEQLMIGVEHLERYSIGKLKNSSLKPKLNSVYFYRVETVNGVFHVYSDQEVRATDGSFNFSNVRIYEPERKMYSSRPFIFFRIPDVVSLIKVS